MLSLGRDGFGRTATGEWDRGDGYVGGGVVSTSLWNIVKIISLKYAPSQTRVPV